MGRVQRAFKFYIDASLHVALSASCLLAVTQLLTNGRINVVNVLFLFCATIVSYNLMKHLEGRYLSLEKLSWPLVVLAGAASLAGLILLFYLAFWHILLFSLLMVLTLLYALPFFEHRSWRALPVMKPLIVALVWVGATYIFSLTGITQFEWVKAIQRMLFMFALIIPFEIKDLKYDSPSLGTLPQLIGTRMSKLVGTICLLLAGTLEMISVQPSIVTGTIYLLLLIMLWNIKVKSPDYLTTFWIEAVPVVWLVVYLFFA